jgi:hypothetical protein
MDIPITILQHTTNTKSLFTPWTLKRIHQNPLFQWTRVDRDVYQAEGLEFGDIKGRISGASFDKPDQPLQTTDAIFQSSKQSHWNACSRSGWTDWRNVVWQLVV